MVWLGLLTVVMGVVALAALALLMVVVVVVVMVIVGLCPCHRRDHDPCRYRRRGPYRYLQHESYCGIAQYTPRTTEPR